MSPDFKEYQRQILLNAKALAEELMRLGYRLVSGGTDNHLMLVDLRDKGITGKEAEKALEEAGITVNKNSIPFDPQPPTITSGIRIGTPALTTRGMKEDEMRYIARLIHEVLSNIKDDKVKEKVKIEVEELCKQFPIYRKEN
jgi:serine hydroxymethyltransferase (EC 2.1.2.1)